MPTDTPLGVKRRLPHDEGGNLMEELCLKNVVKCPAKRPKSPLRRDSRPTSKTLSRTPLGAVLDSNVPIP